MPKLSFHEDHLLCIIRNGDKKEVIKRLKSHPDEITAVTKEGQNAGHLAAIYCPEVFEGLIKERLDLTATDVNGATPLMLLSDPKLVANVNKFINELYEEIFTNKESTKNAALVRVKSGLANNRWSGKLFNKSDETIERPTQRRKAHSADVKSSKPRKRKTTLLSEKVDFSDISLEELIQRDLLKGVRSYVKQNPLDYQKLLKGAYQANAVRVFVWLLKKGATLQFDEKQSLYQHWQKNITPDEVDFLTKVSECIQSQIQSEQLSAAHKEHELLNKKAKFQRQLVEQGLRNKCERDPEDDDKQANDLNEVLYKISTGFDNTSEKDVGHFDAKQIEQRVLGLLYFYTVHEITEALRAIRQHLSKHHEAVALYILMTMVVSDPISKAHHDNTYFETTLKDYFEENTILYEQLLQLAALKRASEAPLVTAQKHITAVLNRSQKISKFSLLDLKPREFANACRSVTSQYYQLIELSEFRNQAWRKDDNDRISPNLVYCSTVTNNFVQFLTLEILSRTELKDRVRVVKLLIQTMDELLQSRIPDYHSLKAISMALNSLLVSKLVSTFDGLKPKTKKRWEELKILLDVAYDSKSLRNETANHQNGLPYVGFYTKDYSTYSEYGDWEKFARIGKIANDIMLKKKGVEDFPLEANCELVAFIHQWKEIPEGSFYTYLFLITQEPLIIDYLTFEEVVEFLMECMKLSVNVKIKYNQRIFSEEDAIEGLFDWFLDKTDSKQAEQFHFFNIMHKLIHAQWPEDEAQKIYEREQRRYMLLFTPVEPMVDQFQQMKVSSSSTSALESHTLDLVTQEPQPRVSSRMSC